MTGLEKNTEIQTMDQAEVPVEGAKPSKSPDEGKIITKLISYRYHRGTPLTKLFATTFLVFTKKVDLNLAFKCKAIIHPTPPTLKFRHKSAILVNLEPGAIKDCSIQVPFNRNLSSNADIPELVPQITIEAVKGQCLMNWYRVTR